MTGVNGILIKLAGGALMCTQALITDKVGRRSVKLGVRGLVGLIIHQIKAKWPEKLGIVKLGSLVVPLALFQIIEIVEDRVLCKLARKRDGILNVLIKVLVMESKRGQERGAHSSATANGGSDIIPTVKEGASGTPICDRVGFSEMVVALDNTNEQ